ncbi:MAG: carboxypeptidase regulatory-like domain-containing protein [Bacteroidia bacterium]
MNRNYNLPDADMFSTGRTHRGHFGIYKTDFINFSTLFDDPFEANWLTSIEASEAYETAETRDDQLQQETQDVSEAMRNSRKCYIGMKFFVELAFADKPAIRQKFGLDNYDEAAQSQSKMAEFLAKLYKLSSVDYNAQLLAAGCPAARIAEIQTIKNTLSTEDTEQNVFKTNEAVATKARITQFNTTYAFDQKVNGASKAIFYDNPEVLNLFLFPRHSEPAELFNVLGTVRDTALALLSGVQVRIYIAAASPIAVTTTDSNGEYGFAAIVPGNYTLEFSKAGYVTQLIAVTVPASGQLTQNADLATAP